MCWILWTFFCIYWNGHRILSFINGADCLEWFLECWNNFAVFACPVWLWCIIFLTHFQIWLARIWLEFFFLNQGHKRDVLLIFFSYNILASFCIRIILALKNELSGKLNGKKIQKREGGYMQTYSWFTSLYSRNEHTTVKQVYSNRKKRERFKNSSPKKRTEEWSFLFSFLEK